MMFSRVPGSREPYIHRREGLLWLALAHYIEIVVLIRPFCIGVIFALGHRRHFLALIASCLILADIDELLMLVGNQLIHS